MKFLASGKFSLLTEEKNLLFNYDSERSKATYFPGALKGSRRKTAALPAPRPFDVSDNLSRSRPWGRRSVRQSVLPELSGKLRRRTGASSGH